MKKRTSEQQMLLEQISQVAQGLGETFAPFCEVVVHDLLHPEHAISAIYNNLSGREVGAPATELGLARISDPGFPQIIANYANQFADGRQAKSTSIGVKDSSGRYIAALCVNVDLTIFRSLQSVLGQFGSVGAPVGQHESLDPDNAESIRQRMGSFAAHPNSLGAESIRNRIDQYAARLATTPRSLKAEDRRVLMRELKESGCLEVRRAMDIVALHLGVSRATVYGDVK